MSYCEPDYWFDEPSEFDEKCEELMDLLRQNVNKEIKEEMESLRKENKRMKEIVDNYDSKVREIEKLKQSLKWNESQMRSDIEKELRRKRLAEIMEGFSSELWRVRNIGKEQPKCDKCDENRLIHFKSPSGRDYTEYCQCGRKLPYYQVEKSYCRRFRICDFENPRKGKLIGWYEPDYESAYTCCCPDGDHKLYQGQDYSEFESEYDVYFVSEEEAQKYADWLNEKERRNKNETD